MNTALLVASNVCVEMHGRRLLHEISFSLDAGKILAVLGANGAGKSTLISVLASEIVPVKGVATLDNSPISSDHWRERWPLTALAERRALNASEPVVPFAMNVEECVALGRPFAAPDRAQIAQALHTAHAAQWSARDYCTLSMGEQTRVQLARSLYQLGDTPRCLWLLDEPCAHLDIAQRQFMLTLIAQIAKSRRWGVVFSTHDPAEAQQIADCVLLMRNGEALICAPVAEALTDENLSACYGVTVARRMGFVAA